MANMGISVREGGLSGFKTESLTMDHRGCRVWKMLGIPTTSLVDFEME